MLRRCQVFRNVDAGSAECADVRGNDERLFASRAGWDRRCIGGCETVPAALAATLGCRARRSLVGEVAEQGVRVRQR